MKKISLDSKVYKKLIELTYKIGEKLFDDDDLWEINLNAAKLSDLLEKERGNDSDDVGIVIDVISNYVILDNMDWITKYLDDSDEVEYLKSNVLWFFEILEKNEEFVKLLDLTSWTLYEIIWEFEFDDLSLYNLEVWDLIMSRIIKLDNGWYHMYEYYTLSQEEYWNDLFEEQKCIYKEHFYWIKDILDLEERINRINEKNNNNYSNQNISNEKINNEDYVENNVNYLKLIKKILLKPLWKKKYKLIENILKRKDEKSFTDFFDFLTDFEIQYNSLDELEEYVNLYLNKPDFEKDNHVSDSFSWFEWLNKKENEIFLRWLMRVEKKDLLAYEDFEKLMEKHSSLYSVRILYVIFRYNFIVAKYLEKLFWEEFNLSDNLKDQEFIRNIKNEIEYLRKLDPDPRIELEYKSIFRDFEELVEKFNTILLVVVGVCSMDELNWWKWLKIMN